MEIGALCAAAEDKHTFGLHKNLGAVCLGVCGRSVNCEEESDIKNVWKSYKWLICWRARGREGDKFT